MKVWYIKGILVSLVLITLFTIIPDVQYKGVKANTQKEEAEKEENVYGKEIESNATVSIPLTVLSESGGRVYYADVSRDILDYDYIRLAVKSKSKILCRTYSGEQSIKENSDIYRDADGMFTEDVSMDGLSYGPADTEENVYTETNYLKDESYITRTLYLPIRQLINENVDVTKLNTITISSANNNEDVTIYSIDLIKLKITKKVQGINVFAPKKELENSDCIDLGYMMTPYSATRQQVRWSSSDEELATVNYMGKVMAGKTKQGIVTITATAVDGSGTYGSIEISIIPDRISPTPTAVPDVPPTKDPVKDSTDEDKSNNGTSSTGKPEKMKQPTFSIKKKKSGRIKYLSLSLKKYEGTYIQIYVKKGKGKFNKIKLKNELIKTYKGKIKIRYLVSKETLFIKMRTYKKRNKSKIYSSYSKIAKIKV